MFEFHQEMEGKSNPRFRVIRYDLGKKAQTLSYQT
jgi:hypothetical protein